MTWALEDAVIVGLISGVVSLIGYLVALAKVRQEAAAQEDLERGLADLRKEMARELAATEAVFAAQTEARLRLFELGNEAVTQVNEALRKCLEALNGFKLAVRQDDHGAAMQIAMQLSMSARSVTIPPAFIPPALDEAATAVGSAAAALAVATRQAARDLESPQDGLEKSFLAGYREWLDAVRVWKNGVWAEFPDAGEMRARLSAAPSFASEPARDRECSDD